MSMPLRNPKLSPVLLACQAIADATLCTPSLALDLGIKVASRRLPLATAIAAARLGTPPRPGEMPLNQRPHTRT